MRRTAASRLRMAVFVIATGVCAITAGSLLYLNSYQPPDCRDPRTIAQVRQEIGRRIGGSAVPELVRIVTIAGSPIGLRYVCKAEFSNPDQLEMHNSVLVSSVRYSSELRKGHQRVSVSLIPLLHWQEVE